MKRRFEDSSGSDKKKIRKEKESENQIFCWTPSELLAPLCGHNVNRCQEVCNLFDNANSIPFIARYRTSITGGMTPDELRAFQESYETLKEVREKGKKFFLALEKEGKMNRQLKTQIANTKTLEELEILSAPFKPEKQGSLAGRARKAGLGEAALIMLENRQQIDLRTLVDRNIEGRKTVDEVEAGLGHILTDIISHSKETLEFAASKCDQARLFIESCKAKETKAAKAKKEKEKVDDAKYDLYFNFSCPIATVKSHQVLALNRGEKSKVLAVKISFPNWFESTCTKFMQDNFLNKGVPFGLRTRLVSQAIEESYKKHVLPWLTRRIRSNLSSEAEKSSIKSFCDNLRNMLLEPPVRGKVILGLDPGYTNGIKLAVISNSGSVLHTGKIYPNFKCSSSPLSSSDRRMLIDNVVSMGVDIIAIGNGMACRETEAMISNLIRSELFRPRHVVYTIANEQGASFYSCSEAAKQEFPNLDPTVIGAITIARRIQDPLSEYVKVDPWNLGVGMYQHDLSQSKLKKSTESVVEECVSFVGVDLNYAPMHILKRISGVGDVLAKAIVSWRVKNGRFIMREHLKKVKGVGDITYQQLSGFVRIYPCNDKNDEKLEPLDSLLIHPESYGLAKSIISSAGFTSKDVGKPNLTHCFKNMLKTTSEVENLASTLKKDYNTIALIVEALSQPLDHDIRERNSGAIFRESVASMSDLKLGISLEGKVTNVTSFGAFVDIGVGKSGLIHCSLMKNMKVALGMKVRVKVIEMNLSKGHIKLSLESII